MKAFLMYPDHDFDVAAAEPPCAQALAQDLELATLLKAMARGDKFLYEVIAKALLLSSADVDVIRYRQDVLRDSLEHQDLIRGIYDLAVAALEAERKDYLGSLSRNPSWVLHRSLTVIEKFVVALRHLRHTADTCADIVRSPGLKRLFAMLHEELSDEYLALVGGHLKQMKFKDGALVSAQLGTANRGINYVLRKNPVPEGNWFTRLFASGPASYSYEIPPRDEGGTRALEELRVQGINEVANALGQSADHITSFFTMLRRELAFYVGCLNLHARLRELGEPTSFPDPSPAPGERHFTASELYDICLALKMERKVVGNDVAADGRDIIIVTGANQGGKSTFLRSVGLAHVMMQCGMFVPAASFSANTGERIFTHYKREEDAEMKGGKFDEELARMSEIADHLAPDSLVLFNESFAATNEREGSEIARQIVTALIERRIKVVFVSHQYEFARGFAAQQSPRTLFLRAERRSDGARTFKVVPGEALQTSYGEDLYREIFVPASS